MFVHDAFMDILFCDLILIISEKNYISGPLQHPVGAKLGPQIDQVAPKRQQNLNRALAFFPTRETLEHRETPNGLDPRVV